MANTLTPLDLRVFYICSFVFTPDEFRHVLDYLLEVSYNKIFV